MSAGGWERWCKFNGAGLLGVGIQTAVLAFLTYAGMGYLVATLLAVECAVLHNFVWHELFTWGDRARVAPRGWPRRLLHFHLANGLISIGGNILLMGWLVGILGGPVLLSNLLAIVLCGTANFVVSDHFVFSAQRSGDAS